LTTALTTLKNDTKLSSKGIMIMENSYAFTTWSPSSAPYTLNSISASDSITGYTISENSVGVQAQEVHDVCSALNTVVGTSRTIGLCYWGACWTCQYGTTPVGWAGSGTRPTWANQALFSYNGRALPSLSVFTRIY
jgi:arabinogalactan endo-1,4-beta-galactosidase